jgi:predicted Zn-dependent peptidase
MPKTEISFRAALNNLKLSIEAERIIKTDILFTYENAQKLGLNDDIRKKVYDQLSQIDLNKVADFAQKYIQNKPNTIIILGSKDKIDLKSLEKYGKVTELTMEQIFGY